MAGRMITTAGFRWRNAKAVPGQVGTPLDTFPAGGPLSTLPAQAR